MKALDELRKIQDPAKRRAYFAALLNRELNRKGAGPVVVVGGSAVEVYTQGSYATGDIDLLASKSRLEEVLERWGFIKKGRQWLNKQYDLYVDWQGGSLQSSKEPVEVEVAPGLTAFIISAEDLVLDRLNAAKFWNDADSLQWAKAVLKVAEKIGTIDIQYLREQAEKQDVTDELRRLLASLKKKRRA